MSTSFLLPRIFVNIASYRDRDCQWTVKDLFAKAAHPERIAVGICWQFIPEEDLDCFIFRTRPEQCRVIEVDARASRGACWARNQVQSLWQGEEYTLQIDSHMRFVEAWDERALSMLALCPSERPVLSSYPSAFTPPDHIDSHVVSVIEPSGFDRDGILKLNSSGIAPADAPAIPAANPFCAAGFLFADSRINREVPYDPYLYFHGEEITLAARLWTQGWDIFTPNDVLAYHDYSNHPGRPRHWKDCRGWWELDRRSLSRVRHLLGVETSHDPEVVLDIDVFGLGSRRSLADYQEFSGVDFVRRLIHGRTTQEIEGAAAPEAKRARNAEVFGRIWRDNSWGSAETRSGPGSALAATDAVRRRLGELFTELDIRSLADVGCGEMNWMQLITPGLQLYLGLDVVDELLEQLRARYGKRRGHFFANLDATVDDLPCCDAILCRDVLTHLPEHGVKAALRRFKESGSRLLIATTHPGVGNQPVDLGGWQPIDLSAPPYGLPPPDFILAEGETAKSLGVWRLSALPDF